MQKSYFFFLVLFFSTIISFGQSQDSVVHKSRFIKSFRVNYNYNSYNDFFMYSYFSNSIDYSGYYRRPTQTIGNVALGYTLKSRKNFNSHDIELSHPSLNFGGGKSSQSKDLSTIRMVTLRYEYNYFFIKRLNISFSPYLGISYLFSIDKNRSKHQYNGNQYHYTDIQLANQFAFVPGIQYRLNDRVYLDLSIPINIFRGSLYQIRNKETPAHNYTARYAGWFSFFNNSYDNIRLGVGIIMNPENRKNESDQKYIKTLKFNFYQYNYFYKNSINLYLSGFSPVIAFQNAVTRNMHEIELTEVRGQFEDERKNYSISARYQFDYFFIKKPSLFAPYLGASALFNYYRYNEKTMLPNYGQSFAYLGYTLAAVPGIQFHPCSKFYLDLSLPVNIWNGALGYNRTDDPSRVQNNSSGLYGDWAKRYHSWNFRLGIGFKL